ncbi:MAG TPA: SPOR domain-containing protein [Vicinamibacterales bacterium]|nr:SPOR domain-containing protein [Vicinamibacterales bacterium]
MAETAHDIASATDDGFHEIQLSGKQLVFLFMIAAVVLVATFLCGVQVGRGVKSDRAVDATTADALVTTTPSPSASTPSQVAASSGPPAAEPPAPAQEPDDELSYAKRLQGDTAPAEKLKSPAASPPASAAPAAQDKPAHALPPKVATPTPKEAATPTPKPAAPAPTLTPPAPKQAAPASQQTAAPAATGQAGGWVVQLVALKDRSEATAVAKRLAGKGYPAFVLDPAGGAPVIYRVQVGGYPDRDHADQAARRIAKEENMQGYVRSR